MRKPGFCVVKEALELLGFPLNSPHASHKDSIESPPTPDTIHFFQAWNTQHSALRIRENGLLVKICGLALSCYTHTHTHREWYAVGKAGPLRTLLQFL